MSEAVEGKSRRRRKRNKGNDDDTTEEEMDNRSVTAPKGRATRSSRQKGEVKGGNFITNSFNGLRTYIAGVRDELDKVVWPTREELIRLTRIVLVVTTIVAIVLGIISFIFTEMFIIGLSNDNPIIFVIFFVVVAVGYVIFDRFLKGSSDDMPY